jgi:hypothetical protein
MLVGFATRLPAATAVPESAMFNGLPEPSLVSATFPLTAPIAVGLNVTLKVALCPGARIAGTVKPEMAKPVPVAVAWLMVRLVPPVLLTVSVRVWLIPTCTFPNAILAGAAVKSPGEVTGAL